jgi:hypothetical protein
VGAARPHTNEPLHCRHANRGPHPIRGFARLSSAALVIINRNHAEKGQRITRIEANGGRPKSHGGCSPPRQNCTAKLYTAPKTDHVRSVSRQKFLPGVAPASILLLVTVPLARSVLRMSATVSPACMRRIHQYYENDEHAFCLSVVALAHAALRAVTVGVIRLRRRSLHQLPT